MTPGRPGASSSIRSRFYSVTLGEDFAIEDVCMHDGGPLDQGELEGECVVCPRHGATFDVRTGDALTLPAVLPLMTFDTTRRRRRFVDA